MAARQILSLLAARAQKQNPAVVSRNFHPSPGCFHRNYEQYTRRFQSLAEANTPVVHNLAEDETCSLNGEAGKSISTSGNDETAVKHHVHSNLKVSARHDLAMIFTCRVCDTRSMKMACRESYDKGIVVARCDGCNNLHLIADRLGWFGEPGSAEEFLAARGELVKKGSADTLNFTLEDLAGGKIS